MVTAALARHMATALERPLPGEVAAKAALHVLDTVAAMISGTGLAAGRKAIPFVAGLGGPPEAQLVGTAVRTSAMWAALGNGMLAHADETDDSHAPSLTHPGCAVVPAALAAAELWGCTGEQFLRAVVAGYDVGPRIAAALGADRFFDLHHSSHSFGGLFGAAAAAAAIAAPGREAAARAALAYAVQLASGNSCWRRDPDHVEKAFDFGGMPAQNGVLAARMAAEGFTGSVDPIEGRPGLFAAFPQQARPELATEGLGERFEVMRTAIKKWCVGSPIQAALDSLEALLAEHRFSAAAVDAIVVSLPKQSAPVVDNRDMPDVCLQHQLALMLLDGTVTFASGHDHSRMADPAIAEMRGRIRIEPRPEQEFVDRPRQAIVEVMLADGRRLSKRTLHVRGTPDNPMTEAEVVAKARDLVDPVIGSDRAQRLVAAILGLSRLGSAKMLVPLLAHDRVEQARARGAAR